MASTLDLLLPYGLAADGRLLAADQVPRGLACACICPNCNRRLIAAQGDIRRWYFRHEPDEGSDDSAPRTCVGAFETMAHRLAKQIIADAAWLQLPPLFGHHFARPVRAIEPQTRIQLADVRLEPWLDGIRPDIFAISAKGSRLAIEVYVAHRCSPDKIAQIRDRQIACIEINLSNFRVGNFDPDNFKTAVLRGPNRIWLFHPRQAAADAKIAAEFAERARIAQQAAEEASRRQAQAQLAQLEREQQIAQVWQREQNVIAAQAVERLAIISHEAMPKPAAIVIPQPSPITAEYDARRCFVCQSTNAWFGFAPPNSSAATTRWACLDHWDQL